MGKITQSATTLANNASLPPIEIITTPVSLVSDVTCGIDQACLILLSTYTTDPIAVAVAGAAVCAVAVVVIHAAGGAILGWTISARRSSAANASPVGDV
jgi:hypothetical protein